MIPIDFPPVIPAVSLGLVFGPLSIVMLLAVVGTLLALVAGLASEAWVAARGRSQLRSNRTPRQTPAHPGLRPAA